MDKKDWKLISLFAGAGGCSLGFSNFGFDILDAYEKDKNAIETYNTNFGFNKCKNIDLSVCNFGQLRDSLNLKKGDLDILIGGPPCQGFTTAGSRFWDDPRNKLVKNYVNALEIYYPRWFMMENVEGILTTIRGKYIIECIKKMIDLGYSIYLKKVYMQEYGIPQRRKRVIIVGSREGKKFLFPKEIQIANGKIYKYGSTNLYDAIHDLENESIPEIDHIIKKETGIKLERIKNLKQGQSMKDLPFELQHNSFKRRSQRRVCDGMPSEKRGGAPSGIKRLIYNEPSLTITSASISEFIHPVEDRMITIRECARIQSFPDDFIFCGSSIQKIKQIGNAIPPSFAEQMARQIYISDNNKTMQFLPGLIYCDVSKSECKSPALKETCSTFDKLMNNNHQGLLMYLCQ